MVDGIHVYDRKPDVEALNILKPYQQKVDSIMSPIIGHSAKNLPASHIVLKILHRFLQEFLYMHRLTKEAENIIL